MTGMMAGQKRPSCAMPWRCLEAMPVCSCYIFSQIAAKVDDGLSRTKPSCRAVCQIFDIMPNTHIVKNAAMPNGQKIDTRGSGVPPIFECQIASYDRPPSGERFKNLSLRSVQICAHEHSICGLLAH